MDKHRNAIKAGNSVVVAVSSNFAGGRSLGPIFQHRSAEKANRARMEKISRESFDQHVYLLAFVLTGRNALHWTQLFTAAPGARKNARRILIAPRSSDAAEGES